MIFKNSILNYRLSSWASRFLIEGSISILSDFIAKKIWRGAICQPGVHTLGEMTMRVCACGSCILAGCGDYKGVQSPCLHIKRVCKRTSCFIVLSPLMTKKSTPLLPPHSRCHHTLVVVPLVCNWPKNIFLMQFVIISEGIDTKSVC